MQTLVKSLFKNNNEECEEQCENNCKNLSFLLSSGYLSIWCEAIYISSYPVSRDVKKKKETEGRWGERKYLKRDQFEM